jgi:uncharacterized protein (TIGR02246 family)
VNTLSAIEEDAVRAVVHKYAEAWNAHDMIGLHDIDTDDVQWINVRGNHWLSKETVHKGHEAILRTALSKATLEVLSLDVRGIAPGVAIAVAIMKFGPLIIPSGQEVPYVKTIGSFVMLGGGREWKINHFHNTLIDAESEQHDPTTWDESGYTRANEKR